MQMHDISHGLNISPAAPQEMSQLGGVTLPDNPIAGTIYDNPKPPKITIVGTKEKGMNE